VPPATLLVGIWQVSEPQDEPRTGTGAYLRALHRRTWESLDSLFRHSGEWGRITGTHARGFRTHTAAIIQHWVQWFGQGGVRAPGEAEGVAEDDAEVIGEAAGEAGRTVVAGPVRSGFVVRLVASVRAPGG
jgi:hypothetical protein